MLTLNGGLPLHLENLILLSLEMCYKLDVKEESRCELNGGFLWKSFI